MKSSKRTLPENITQTKNGYHVRMVINGEYHAEHYSYLNCSKEKALQKAKKKKKQFEKLRSKQVKSNKPKRYDTRFLYENPDNSTGIIGVFIREEQSKEGKVYPYYCTTIIDEKDKPKSYSRSMKKWGRGEALIQICCIRKNHMSRTYPERFDRERFDKSVVHHMEENFLSYTDDALERLAKFNG